MSHNSRTSDPNGSTKSWLDGLSECLLSGTGRVLNASYVAGQLNERHPFEDRSAQCRLDNSTHFYGIFDGYNGSKVADCGLQRMAAEILLGQLGQKNNDEEIKEVLRQAFVSVEKGYNDSIGDIKQNSAKIDVSQKSRNLRDELSSGAHAVAAIVHNDKLYVGNVGTCRALLCKTDNSVLKVVQLSIDHNLWNEDELLRISQLGVNLNPHGNVQSLGNQRSTRCLGNYMLKEGYRNFPELRNAKNTPVVPDAEIHGGIVLDTNCCFLLLTSSGLTATLQTLRHANDVNKYIAQLVVEQARRQYSLEAVAQAVVNKIAEEWRQKNSTGFHEDMTLVIRNFNFALLNATQTNSDTSSMTTSSATDTNGIAPLDGTVRIKPYVDFSSYYKIMQDKIT